MQKKCYFSGSSTHTLSPNFCWCCVVGFYYEVHINISGKFLLSLLFLYIFLCFFFFHSLSHYSLPVPCGELWNDIWLYKSVLWYMQKFLQWDRIKRKKNVCFRCARALSHIVVNNKHEVLDRKQNRFIILFVCMSFCLHCHPHTYIAEQLYQVRRHCER